MDRIVSNTKNCFTGQRESGLENCFTCRRFGVEVAHTAKLKLTSGDKDLEMGGGRYGDGWRPVFLGRQWTVYGADPDSLRLIWERNQGESAERGPGGGGSGRRKRS
jgi:hypothetical protein